MSQPTDRAILEQAFAAAVELRNSERASFLNDFSEQHGHLADDLRALLAADSSEEGFLTGAMAASIENLTDTLEDPWIGRTLGAWKVIRRLGTGGMGAVFLVDRVDRQFHQKAALKLMSSRLLSNAALSRFRAERQILANLSHPNIANLIDGGATDADLPYLVMEYVDGDHIDQYCDTGRLTIEARLTLFLKVCDAVDYAHRQLVVHRDLKPANILIDSAGAPKLLDFGIAKLLEPDDADVTAPVTHAGQRAMTPEYASPEQVRGESVSVATDVYALGVLLFRLLTGQSPYGDRTGTPRELESAILERPPSRPSAVVSRMTDGTSVTPEEPSVQDLSARRGISPDALRRRLSDDLDNIVLMCLQKDAQRRYASVRDLAADLRRYLNHQPVIARGDDWVYRSRKFVVRNARALLSFGAVSVVVIGLIVFYTLQLASERDRAQIASDQSRRIADFLSEVFESADPAVAQGQELTARELLARGVADIDSIDAPLVRAELQRVMGASLTELGDYEKARTLLAQSVALFQADPDAEPLALARSLSDLGEVNTQRQAHAEAIAERREALHIVETQLGADHEIVPLLLSRLGRSLNSALEVDEALTIWQRALEVQRQQGTYGNGLTSDILGGMATAHDNLGNYAQAIKLIREAIPMSEAHLGRLDPNTVIMLSNLGLVYGRLGDMEQCASYLGEAIDRAGQIWPKDHPRLMFYLNNFAIASLTLGDFDAADAAFQKVEAVERSRDGGESAGLVNLLYASSGLYTARGEYGQALDRYTEAYEMSRRLLGEESELTLINGIGRGVSLLGLGRYQEATAALRKVLEHEAHLRQSHLLYAKLKLGDAMSRAGDLAAGDYLAKVILEKSADIGSDNVGLREYLMPAARHFRQVRAYDRALSFAERLYRLEQAAREHSRRADDGGAALEYGLVLAALGRKGQAEPVLQAAQSELTVAYGASDPRVLEVADALAALQ